MNETTRAYLGAMQFGRALLVALLRGPCGATDGAGVEGGPFGRCNMLAGHDGDWHTEYREGQLWAEWRGPHPGQRCNICGKGVVAHWEGEWSRHIGECSSCGTSRLDNCGQGVTIKSQLSTARAALCHERELDRKPMSGQAGLW